MLAKFRIKSAQPINSSSSLDSSGLVKGVHKKLPYDGYYIHRGLPGPCLHGEERCSSDVNNWEHVRYSADVFMNEGSTSIVNAVNESDNDHRRSVKIVSDEFLAAGASNGDRVSRTFFGLFASLHFFLLMAGLFNKHRTSLTKAIIRSQPSTHFSLCFSYHHSNLCSSECRKQPWHTDFPVEYCPAKT